MTLPWTSDFTPITLEAINMQAELQTRVDRKYLVSREVPELLDTWLDPSTQILQVAARRSFSYESVYFDTPDLVSYHRAARGRRRRFKLRTRAYLDSGIAFLEAKTKGSRGTTVKERIPHELHAMSSLNPEARTYAGEVLSSVGLPGDHAWSLAPTLSTGYKRTTLVLPEDSAGTVSRLTIDTDLRWALHPRTAFGTALERPDLAIIETKSARRASSFDRLLWSHGIRPVSISKYSTGLAALRPDLTANKWSRVLNQTLRSTQLEGTR
ncbi:polyphosphate polymerase domain-containing protein [Nesterenkonia halotolerans]|uniref:polyphosphate polymerase domain-containing protein n=1 Tax=Nesterenkonia halotolerans TaxID=225325 RepID=UPI003EE49EEA